MAEIAAVEPQTLVSSLAPLLPMRTAKEIVQSAQMILSDRVESLNKEVADIAQLFSTGSDNADKGKENADSLSQFSDDGDLFD